MRGSVCEDCRPSNAYEKSAGYVCDRIIYDVGLAKYRINLASMEKRGIKISGIMIAEKGKINGIQGRYGTVSGIYQQTSA